MSMPVEAMVAEREENEKRIERLRAALERLYDEERITSWELDEALNK